MRSDGFSFVEVMVALVILSISLIVLSESQTRSLALVSKARAIDSAVTLAGAKMAEVTETVREKGVSALKDEETGEFDQEKHPGYRWRTRVEKIPSPDFARLVGAAGGGEDAGNTGNAALFAGPLRQIERIWGQALRQLTVEVLWTEGTREKSYELVTHLIAPDAIGQLQGFVGGLGGAGGAR
jgi:prepilin-type N-terminal cleavage/methylation domain-containing protein